MNKCWFIKVGNPTSCCRLKMNPVVTIVSAFLLWTMIILFIAMPDQMYHYLIQGKEWVADGWSWLYIVSQDIWIVLLIYIAVHPKYGKLKLGRDDEEPVFSDITWFSLLFTCGVAVGMFYYVAEPMWHFKGYGGARFVNNVNGHSTPSEDAVHGMMVTWYHWGLHGWIPYTTVGALLGLMAYRRGFPLSMRFGFYPLIGDRVYGWIGDLIDILSIVTTVMGVCTSLGLGTMSINMGMQRLSQGFFRGTSESVPDDPINEFPTCAGTGNKYWGYVKHCDEKWAIPAGGTEHVKQYARESFGVQANITSQALIITVITLMATVSVVSGLKYGIKELARLGFTLSAFLLVFVLCTGDTVFQLNLTIQTFGYYIWYLPKIAFHTDAFELLGMGNMGRGGFGGEGGRNAGNKMWMDMWTIFYWGWWISWAPFVGTFLAKISRGRTLRQFIVATLFAPSAYCFLWFGTVGGETILMQSLAQSSGLCGNAWLNGGGKGAPPGEGAMKCNLSPEELDKATGKCKDKATMVADGLITAEDMPHCGRGKCSGKTLKQGYCGKMLPTCDHYSATYSAEQKKILGIGYTPSCKLQANGEKHPVLSGVCKQFAWEHWVQKQDQCILQTTWVPVPCGAGADPTALDFSALACGSGGHPGNPTGKAMPAYCQDPCKDKITKAMIDIDSPGRMFNHFTTGSVESEAIKDQGIYENLEKEFGPDETILVTDVWKTDSLAGLDAAGKKQPHLMARPDGSASPSIASKATTLKRLNPPSCFIPVPNNQVCVWNQLTEDVLFDLIGSLTESSSMSVFLSIIALISLVIYFITSSDSGSLVVDILAANGEEEPPIPQRIFWAFTEGATAIALLYSGVNVVGPFGDPGQGGLRAIQAASIVMGLPYTFVLFWYSQALLQVCREEAGDLDAERPRFKMFLMGAPRSDKVALGAGIGMLFKNLIAPGFSPAVQEATRSWPLGSLTNGRIWQVALQILWILSFALAISGVTAYALFTMSGGIYFIFAGWMSLVRREIRKQWGIPRGDFFTDLMWTCIAFPFVLTQLEIQMKEERKKYDKENALSE